MKEYNVGDIVHFRALPSEYTGPIAEKQPAITMNGAVLIAPRYKIAYRNGDKSGWISSNDIEPAKE